MFEMSFRYLKTMFAVLFTTVLIGMVFAIPHMGMSMDMAGHMDCPFMIGEQALCEMNVLDHMGALQSIFSVLAPTLLVLLAVAFVAIVFRIFGPPDHIPLLYLQRRVFSYRSLFKDLFIGSVLNPRAP